MTYCNIKAKNRQVGNIRNDPEFGAGITDGNGGLN